MNTYDDIANAQIIDACMRLKLPYRVAPVGIKAANPISGIVHGPAIPVRHYGSGDVFLEVFQNMKTPGILVIDNGGRLDEACIGDLIVLEAKLAKVSAIVVWGLHRDSRDLGAIELPVFSYGVYPAGPNRLDAWEPEVFKTARFGDFVVGRDDTVFVDADGVVFVETAHLEQILPVASAIRENEFKQAANARNGTSLREQFAFADYLRIRSERPDYTFRKHLTANAKALEE